MRRIIMLVALLSIITLTSLVLIYTPVTVTQAQDANRTMQTLLVDLNQQMQNDGLVISITFASVPSQMGQGLAIGYRDGMDAQFHEIGTDYVCLRQPSGDTARVTCIPYSNITDIAYFER